MVAQAPDTVVGADGAFTWTASLELAELGDVGAGVIRSREAGGYPIVLLGDDRGAGCVAQRSHAMTPALKTIADAALQRYARDCRSDPAPSMSSLAIGASPRSNDAPQRPRRVARYAWTVRRSGPVDVHRGFCRPPHKAGMPARRLR